MYSHVCFLVVICIILFFLISIMLPRFDIYGDLKERILVLIQGQIYCMTWHTDKEKEIKSDTSKSRGMFMKSHFTEWEEKEKLIKP